MVEHRLAKARVAGPNPVSRSDIRIAEGGSFFSFKSAVLREGTETEIMDLPKMRKAGKK